MSTRGDQDSERMTLEVPVVSWCFRSPDLFAVFPGRSSIVSLTH